MKDKDFDIALGQALRDEREKRKLVQDDIAEKLNVTKMTISNYELGNRSMTAKALQEYCAALGVTIQSVIDRVGV
jgi:transcriptional regulator with XRE-family HTH domain